MQLTQCAGYDFVCATHTVRADERDLYLYSVPYAMYFFGNKRPTAGVPDIFRGGEDGGTTGTMHLCNWSVVELQRSSRSLPRRRSRFIVLFFSPWLPRVPRGASLCCRPQEGLLDQEDLPAAYEGSGWKEELVPGLVLINLIRPCYNAVHWAKIPPRGRRRQGARVRSPAPAPPGAGELSGCLGVGEFC